MDVRIAVAARGVVALGWCLTLATVMRGAPDEPAATPASANGPPLKPARSEFDIREFSTLFNDVLLVPHPGGALPTSSRPCRGRGTLSESVGKHRQDDSGATSPGGDPGELVSRLRRQSRQT